MASLSAALEAAVAAGDLAAAQAVHRTIGELLAVANTPAEVVHLATRRRR